ncbi:chalcone isomerase family protein [Colwellia echini]|uniref:Chalcone isomerase domain-containing protein n=1 Tax=Colwellia echini TaxID=1982103 RepID=A0ABY3MYA5_9GAMM|nr:chalcone isomerase family protein [Colwellia echini]TYK66213.1 hypothetical protein CWS31_006295 [Colwellia echini]
MNKTTIMGFILLSFIWLSLISLKVNSAPLDDDIKATLPDNYSEIGLTEVGRAQFTVLFWDIYNSTLYTELGRYNHNDRPESMLFKIEYLKDISTDDLIERTVQQWQHLDIAKEQYHHFIPMLQDIWPEISAGDSLAMLVNGDQSIFYFNNVQAGIIDDHRFSRIFLDIWLSPNTSQPKLREQLLGEEHNE